MKRLTLVSAVVVGLAVATMVGLWSSNSASAGRFEDGLKCYQVKNIETFHVERGPLIYIRDQYQEKNLIVKKPINFCTRAEKSPQSSGTAAGVSFDEIVCYDIKDAPGQPRFRPLEIFAVDQFDENEYLLTKPYSLCEHADKQVQHSATAGEGFHNFDFMCYRVRRIENGDRFNKISLRLFDQFEGSGKDVRLGRPVVFCTQVDEKKNKAKTNHIENAALLEPDNEVHVSTISATRDRSDPVISCAPWYGHSVWYTYTPGYDQITDIDTNGSTYDTVLAIFRGDPANGDEVACDDDGGNLGASDILTKLDYGQKYFILVGAYGDSAGGKLKLLLDIEDECASCGSGTTAAVSVADKASEGDASGNSLQWNLMCYSLSQRAPDNFRVQTEDQLTISAYDIGRGVMYCTPAGKCKLVDGDGAGEAALPAGASPVFC